MSAARTFFDTNVLLYMYSAADPCKQLRAQELFEQSARSGEVLLSTQVVQEFYTASSRKLALPRGEVRAATAALLDLPMVILGPTHIRAAIEIEERDAISFWDALIVAAAEAGGAELLYTEDLTDGQLYGKVMVRNPFVFDASRPTEPQMEPQ
jgi:predicted nucleic acid-binding protein